MNQLLEGLKKIVSVLEQEDINYMIVGGFAMSYFNLARFTTDIDFIVQIHPIDVEKILKHFPEWENFNDAFKESVQFGRMFNLLDFNTGVKYDFMSFKDSDYNWTAFERRQRVDFMGVECYISSPEDLIISKLIWYGISKSEKQKTDILYQLNEVKLDKNYIELWLTRQNILRYGIL